MKFNLRYVSLFLAAACSSVEAVRTPQFSAGTVKGLVNTKLNERSIAEVQHKAVRVSEDIQSEDFEVADNLQIRGGDSASSGMIENLKIGFYFLAWYALNVIYNSKFLSLSLSS